MNKTWIIILGTLLGTTVHAQSGESRTWGTSYGRSEAGVMLEPILTAGQENASIQTSQIAPGLVSDTSTKIDSRGIGLRIGGHAWETLLFGLDARYSKAGFNDSALGSSDGDAANVGPMIGVQTPLWGIRLTGTYILDGYFDPKTASSGVDARFNKMNGYRVGAGLHVYGVGIGVEYQNAKYDESLLQSVGPFALNQNTSVDLKSEGYNLNLSFPIEL